MDEIKKKKALLLCVTSQNVITFRSGFIKKLKEENYDVSVVAFDDEYREEIESQSIKLYCVQDKNRSLNPFKILSLKRRYRKIIRVEKPDVVFTYMMKPNIFGCKAAKAEKIDHVYSMVEGAGDVFINNSLKWKGIRLVVCKLYKSAFKIPKKVFFINNDDKEEFIARKLVKSEQCEVVHGVGVDLEKFSYQPLVNTRSFLMVARMIRTKGVLEYCEAARIVKKKYPDAVFNYIGSEGELGVKDIKEYIEDNSVCYLGTTKNMLPHYQNCSINVLPSYREGFGLVNIEAGAVGRASITCGDAIGTKDTIVDKYNGLFIKRRSVEDLVEKVIYFIEHPEEVERMGKNARAFAEKYFDSKKINEQIFKVIEE